MDKKNLVIGVLAVAVVILTYYVIIGRGKHGYSEIDDIPQETELLLSKIVVDSLDGECYAAKDSLKIRDFIREYQESRFKPDIMAYHISVEHIREMVRQADSVDRNADVPDHLKVMGYRFYHAITDRSNYNSSLGKKKDLVIVPVLRNKKDFVEVYADLEDDKILSEIKKLKMYTGLRPCPRLCGDSTSILNGTKCP